MGEGSRQHRVIVSPDGPRKDRSFSDPGAGASRLVPPPTPEIVTTVNLLYPRKDLDMKALDGKKSFIVALVWAVIIVIGAFKGAGAPSAISFDWFLGLVEQLVGPGVIYGARSALNKVGSTS